MDVYAYDGTEEPMCALDPLLLIPRIEYAGPIFSFVRSKNIPYSLVILDMKNFHVINDIHGYETGDEVLSKFIFSLRSRLPYQSITLRFRHGDEFLFFLPLSTTEADTLFEDFRNWCESRFSVNDPHGVGFTVSFRFASLALVHNGMEYRDLLRLAEARLRAVKGQGSLRQT